MEKEQAAALFGEMAFEAAGKLAKELDWDPGDPRRVALHGIIGGIMAEISGGKFGEGLTAAAINKLVTDQLLIALKDGKIEMSSDELRWISTIIGGAISGNQGAGITDSATANNALALPLLAPLVIDGVAIGTATVVGGVVIFLGFNGEEIRMSWDEAVQKGYVDENYFQHLPNGISKVEGDDGVIRYWLDGIQLTEIETQTYLSYNYQPGDPINNTNEERKQKNHRPNKPKDDIPGWVKVAGAWPYAKESGKDFALRVIRWAQANGQSYVTGKGPRSLYNQLKK